MIEHVRIRIACVKSLPVDADTEMITSGPFIPRFKPRVRCRDLSARYFTILNVLVLSCLLHSSNTESPLNWQIFSGLSSMLLGCHFWSSKGLPFLKLQPHEVDGFPVVVGSAETKGAKQLGLWSPCKDHNTFANSNKAMEVFGKSVVAVPTNVIYLSSILGQDGPNPVHKCDWKCENENVCGNMFRCKLTGLTHICDKNCNQRILYDNHSSLCRVSRQVFPLTAAEVQAVKGVRRKLDEESSSPPESCAFKRRRNAQFHPSPFERSFSAVGPICSQVGDGMDMN